MPDPHEALRIERVLSATPERVFAAFLDAQSLGQWWGPEGFTSPTVELDPRAGGGYRITMQPPEGEAFHLRGDYREIAPPRRLVFTFAWEEPDPDDRETVVTLVFEPTGDGTRIVVKQEPFTTTERHELHRAGWTQTLDRLERALA